MLSSIIERAYRWLLVKRGLQIGVNCRWSAPLPVFSKPYSMVKIGNNVLISGNVTFITHDGSSFVLRNLKKKYIDVSTVRPISIGNNCFIGYDTTILAGINIGDNVIIGAKSLVTKDCESDSVYAGVPARRICSLLEYEDKFNEKYMPLDSQR